MAMELLSSLCLSFLFLTTLCQFCQGKVLACPHACICHSDTEKLDCLLTNGKSWMQTCSELNNGNAHPDEILIDLKLRRSNMTSFPNLSCLPGLNSLDLSHLGLKTIHAQTFQNVTIASGLDLSWNHLSDVSFEASASLQNVQSLNLSNNQIKSVTNTTFKNLSQLRSLDLSHNLLKVIAMSTFTGLKGLQHLNLAYNKLVYFSSWHLPVSLSLRVLMLPGNKLQGLDLDRTNLSSSPIRFLTSLDISDNPLDCSCTLDYLLEGLPQHVQSLENVLATTCKTPKKFENAPLLSLNETSLICKSPRNIVGYPSHEKAVLYRDVIQLECKSDGYPPPSIIWVTPWGEKFADSRTLSLVSQSGFSPDDLLSHKQYEDKYAELVTTIQASDNNDLIISGFRGSMTGQYTCLAYNIAGNKSVHMNLTVTSMIKPVYASSLFIGGYTASGMLILGFLLAFIKMNIIRLRHKNCFKVPIFSKAPSVRPAKDTLSSHFDFLGKDGTNVTEFSPCSLESHQSDRVLEDFPPSPTAADKRPHLFIESLEEAKGKLRSGVERKVESMKRNVQSIKHSSSAYVHTIMESGSSAASRMKASVAVGVETVKSHVQSFKELCGTGDMGMHTISMVSVETDIDTNKQTSIIKQVTFV